MTRFRHILVPVDFEPPSQEALEAAVDLALTFDAKLTLFHAWEVPAAAYAAMTYVPADFWTAIEQAATEQLKSAVEDVRKRLPRAESILAKGPPAQEILSAADRTKADLIVMGTHGRRGMSHVLLGSVAERVVRLSPVPVLTIRGKDREQA
jgi:nucleotide-binding universal stress UspA family protein